MDLSVSNGLVSSKIYDKRSELDVGTVNVPFLDGDVPGSTSYRVNIAQLIRFAGVSGHMAGLVGRGRALATGLLQQGCRCHGFGRFFLSFFDGTVG